MTCREKLKELNPEWGQCQLDETMNEECPDVCVDIEIPRYEDGSCWCGTGRCEQCWDREIPGTEHLTYKHTTEPIGKVTELTTNDNGVTAKIEPTNSHYARNEKEKNMATKKTKAELMEELETVKNAKAELEKEIKNLEKYKQYEDMAGEVYAIYMSFVQAGFSEEQAYDLLKTMIANAGQINFNTSTKPTYRSYR